MTRRKLLQMLTTSVVALSAVVTRMRSPRRAEAASGFFEGPAQGLLLAVADVIVPSSGDSPSAGQIDLVPRLEAWIHRSPHRTRLYRAGWPIFEMSVIARVPYKDGRPDPAGLTSICEEWYRKLRQGEKSRPAAFFEQLRRDIMRIYYSSPEGWAWVGYEGPVYRSHPRGNSGS